MLLMEVFERHHFGSYSANVCYQVWFGQQLLASIKAGKDHCMPELQFV